MAWLIVIVAVMALMAVPWFGADSRDGADWKVKDKASERRWNGF
jgi:hypothetical protein